MLVVGLETTNRCNLKCLHCLRDKEIPVHDLDIDVFNKLLREIKVFGQSWVGLTGGEPTLHPQFEYIIAALSNARISFNLVSNGWNFKEIMPVFLRDRGTIPKAITFSLDGAKEETHDKMRARQGSFRRVMEAVTLCRARMIPFTLQMSVCSLNEAEMEEMCFLAVKLGAASMYFNYIFPTPGLISRKLMKPPRDCESFLKKVHNLASAFRIPVFTNHQLGTRTTEKNFLYDCCYFAGNYVNVDCRSNVTFCCNLSTYSGAKDNKTDIIGSLKKESFVELYKKLLRVTYVFQVKRIEDVYNGRIPGSFGCLHCARYFKKTDWVNKFPQSEWCKFYGGKQQIG